MVVVSYLYTVVMLLLCTVVNMAMNIIMLRRMEQVDRITVLGLQVTPDQLPFVDHPVDIILNEKALIFMSLRRRHKMMMMRLL